MGWETMRPIKLYSSWHVGRPPAFHPRLWPSTSHAENAVGIGSTIQEIWCENCAKHMMKHTHTEIHMYIYGVYVRTYIHTHAHTHTHTHIYIIIYIHTWHTDVKSIWPWMEWSEKTPSKFLWPFGDLSSIIFDPSGRGCSSYNYSRCFGIQGVVGKM